MSEYTDSDIDYQKLKEEYDPKKVFDTLNIVISIKDTKYDDQLSYVIDGISFRNKCETEFMKSLTTKLSDHFKETDLLKSFSPSHKSWSAFYLFKELIDCIESNSESKQCYYRGQTSNWPLAPTIFREGRKGFTDNFRESYNKIFGDIKRRFPHQFKANSNKPSEEALNKATELSILQHYGFGTPLLDITENPFVAMLFMTHNYEQTVPFLPELDVFFVVPNGDHRLFQSVRIEDDNPRLIAQQGAFLDFDYLGNIQSKIGKINSAKIERVQISVDYKSDQDLHDNDDKDIENDREKDTMRLVGKELLNKLSSFHYNYEDLFPDFSNYITYLKGKYQGREQDTGDTNTIYKMNRNF